MCKLELEVNGTMEIEVNLFFLLQERLQNGNRQAIQRSKDFLMVDYSSEWGMYAVVA